MKLDYIQIDAFKNLRDFKFDFDEKNAGLVTVILGRNGSGKSNLLEALVIIFRDLYLGQESEFGYELRYTLQKGAHHVVVINRPSNSGKDRFSFFAKDGTVQHKVSRSDLKNGAGHQWLPKHIFAYYSGPSDRLEQHFRKHQKIFDEELRKGKDRPLRPLFYARPVHSQFVLLSFFNSDDPKVKSFLEEHLLIESLESALFVLHEPDWDGRKDGDPRFWGAYGVVASFLDRLFKCALAPMRLAPHSDTPHERKTHGTQLLYLYLQDRDALRKLAPPDLAPSEFFKQLESTYIATLIQQLRIRVKVRHYDGSLTFRELSEGEQQLLTVVGLLRFTKETDSLFLLDEPDTHLNPAWGMKYLETLNAIAEPGSDSQVLMATHDPLVLAALKRNEVVVMERNEHTSKVEAFRPDLDPQGLGVVGILRSAMFGLRTTLDLPTQDKLDRRFELVAKDAKRTEIENAELLRLSEELAAAGFAHEFRDAMYDRYAKALGKVRDKGKATLTRQEIGDLEKEAKKMVAQLQAEDKAAR
jgi:predicted ATPase/HAMP domain-containing protein